MHRHPLFERNTIPMIRSYLPTYQLLPWISQEYIDLDSLSSNPSDGAIELLRNSPENINWTLLSANPNDGAVDLLLANPDNINWTYLSKNTNPRAVDYALSTVRIGRRVSVEYAVTNPNDRMLEHALNRITQNQNFLSERRRILYSANLSTNTNSHAIDYLLQNFPSYIYMPHLLQNSSDRAVDLILFANTLEGVDIDGSYLSKNSNGRAIDLLFTNPDLIDWYSLSENSNDRAVDLLLANPDRIEIDALSRNLNPRVLPILAENVDLIDWAELSTNPHIFERLHM